MSVYLNSKERKLMEAMEEKYPGGVDRTDDLFQIAATLEELGLAESMAVSVDKVGVRLTEAGRQYLRAEKANTRSKRLKIAGCILTLVLLPVLVNLISDYVLPMLFK